MRTIILFILFFITFGLKGQNSNDSINYHSFLSNFKQINLPIDYSKSGNYIFEKIIDSTCLRNFICDMCNFCEETYSLSDQRYYFNSRILKNDKIDIITYFSNNVDQKTKNNQIILTTYSNSTMKKINKLVVWGEMEGRYLIHSKINSNYEIEMTTIYSNELGDRPYLEKRPEVFFIYEIKAKYRIEDNGEIIKIYEGKPVQYLAKMNYYKKNTTVFYEYPVEVKK